MTLLLDQQAGKRDVKSLILKGNRTRDNVQAIRREARKVHPSS